MYRKYTNWWEIPTKTCISETRGRGFEIHGQSENVLKEPMYFDPMSGLLFGLDLQLNPLSRAEVDDRLESEHGRARCSLQRAQEQHHVDPLPFIARCVYKRTYTSTQPLPELLRL